MSSIPLRHGICLPPFHPMDENPATCIDRDLELMQWLDRLGFHEAWIGEHHSAGWEIISSPELFIAVAAERTRSLRFGTGVISLPYHNPLMVANRFIQLDHHTRGRVMFGAGPGLLRVARDEVVEAVEEGLGLGAGLPLHALRHHRGGGREDGAARALEADVLDDVALHREHDLGPVAAERVAAFGRAVGPGQGAEVPRPAAVVQDRLLVQLAQLGRHRKTSRTLCRARTRTSMSPR